MSASRYEVGDVVEFVSPWGLEKRILVEHRSVDEDPIEGCEAFDGLVVWPPAEAPERGWGYDDQIVRVLRRGISSCERVVEGGRTCGAFATRRSTLRGEDRPLSLLTCDAHHPGGAVLLTEEVPPPVLAHLVDGEVERVLSYEEALDASLGRTTRIPEGMWTVGTLSIEVLGIWGRTVWTWLPEADTIYTSPQAGGSNGTPKE